MSYHRRPWQEVLFGLGKPPPFFAALLITLGLGCLADVVEPLRMLVAALRLTPAVWEQGQMWRVVTYGFVGHGGISMWVVVQLVLVYWLGQQMLVWLGRERARVVLLGGIAVAGVVAVMVQAAAEALGGPSCDGSPFWLMQGQSVVIGVGLGVFASNNRHSTLSFRGLFFGLPIPVKWVPWLHLLLAFGGALGTGDLAGFVGLVTAMAWGWRSTSRARRPVMN